MSDCPDFPNYGPGECIDNRFLVDKQIGQGGFGAVYFVTDKEQQDSPNYALKTEIRSKSTNLKQEVYVLRLANIHGCTHFCQFIAAGMTDYKGFPTNYLVMSLIGETLEAKKKKRFTLGCALAVGMQCLTAIEELHSIGYLHRDLKPENFAVSKPNETRIIIFDFGLCRQYLDDQGRIRLPRVAIGFRGTTRYASLSCHARREMSRKCDIESWFYQQVELSKGAIPWRDVDGKKKDLVGMFKERCRYGIGLELFLGGCPRQYVEILRYIDRLSYYETPDYNKIHNLLRMAMKVNNVKEVYDWVQPDSQAATQPTETVEALSPKKGKLKKFWSVIFG
ncbi:hypothetical protein L596_023289 [Steinernema carpocapsae]|uniref:Protein kinase domain-containing protein n=1 Tax=Steinernema carpocapsae TaxID=34508 RepID=A0A4V5ZZD4_STECR|nr:hypothetical protein L596_023289 [Steinernema carpocapsae]